MGDPTGRLQVVAIFQTAPSFTSYSQQTAYIRDGDELFVPASQTPA